MGKAMQPILLFIFVAICILRVQAVQKPTYYLNPEKDLTQYSYQNWTSENGLPTNSLLHLIQSSQGYLWVTSYSGLIRFDGHTFKVYNNINVPELEGNVIRNLVEDQNGILWMSTQGMGLMAYENGQFKSYGKELNLTHLYRGLLADDKNRIWSASPDHGWFYFEKGKFNFIEYSTSLKNIEVRSIVQSNTGEIWFGTLGKGIFKYDNGQLKSYRLTDGLTDDWVYSLYVDSDNNLWIGTSTGLCFFNGNRFEKILSEINTTVNKILKDRYGNLWIGTIDGIYRLKNGNKTLEHFSTENGLSNNFIIDFIFDREGDFWVTHYKGGLSRIKDGKFTNYTEIGGLPGKVVNSVCEFRKQHFLVGFDNGALAEIDKGKIIPFRLKSNLNGNRIRHIMSDSNRNLWISTYLGLLQIRPNGTEQWFKWQSGLSESKIRLTFEDSKGNIWVGTRNSGLIKIDKSGNQKLFNVENGLTSNLIMSIAEDKNGSIWVGTSEGQGGLNSISASEKVTAFTREQGFDSDIVFNIHCDNDGVLWIATTTGLWIYKKSKFYNVSTKQGLPENSIFDAVEDDFGSMWMPFEEGIMRVNKSDLLSCILQNQAKISSVIYSKSDGMSCSECNPTAQVLKSSSGRLFFPTLDGISSIDPMDELINNYIPPVIVEELKVDDEQVDIGKPIEIMPRKKRFTFTYTSISLYDSEKIKFKYQLVGFDEKWVEADNARSVSYTNLPSGSYSFNVTATNSDGIWNDSATQLQFTIKPHFFETKFFYILILVVAFLIVYLFYVYRITHLKQNQDVLEKNINERTREILKKNQELEQQKKEILEKNKVLNIQKAEIEKQSVKLEQQKEELKESNIAKDKIFAIISHDLRGPLGNIKNMLDLMVKKNDQFDEAKRNRIMENLFEITTSTFYLIDNLLSWSRSQRGLVTYDPQMFLVDPLVNEIIALTQASALTKNIEVVSKIQPPDLAFGDVNMVKTIFRNLMENALKFTPENGRVEISSKQIGDEVEFAVCDNGVGMSKEAVDKILKGYEIQTSYGTNREKGSGLGLLLCKDFIKRSGGIFRIESTPQVGSTFFFTLKRFQL